MIVLASCTRFYGTDVSFSPDDPLLLDALRLRNIAARIVSWDDPDFVWSDATMVIVTSTWDCFERFDEFQIWLSHVSHVSLLLNPYEAMQWLLRKTYLRALEGAGVPLLPTIFYEKGQEIVCEWEQGIAKPVIGSNGIGNMKLGKGEILVPEWDVLVQPLLSSVDEAAHVIINGVWSHAYQKYPFHHYDLTDAFTNPLCSTSQEERDLAVATYRTVERLTGTHLLAGRVDIFRQADAPFVVNEVECVEPLLYLKYGTALPLLVRSIQDIFNIQVPRDEAPADTRAYSRLSSFL